MVDIISQIIVGGQIGGHRSNSESLMFITAR